MCYSYTKWLGICIETVYNLYKLWFTISSCMLHPHTTSASFITENMHNKSLSYERFLCSSLSPQQVYGYAQHTRLQNLRWMSLNISYMATMICDKHKAILKLHWIPNECYIKIKTRLFKQKQKQQNTFQHCQNITYYHIL